MNNRNEHRDDFEQLLKQAADSLRLTPAPKVWKGIFNGLQPGIKYPSHPILLLILCCFFMISPTPKKNFTYLKSTVSKKTLIPEKVLPDAPITSIQTYLSEKIDNLQVSYLQKNETPALKAVMHDQSALAAKQTAMISGLSKSSSHYPNSTLQNKALTISYKETNPAIRIPSATFESHWARQPVQIKLDNQMDRGLAYQLYATSSFTTTGFDLFNRKSDEEKNVGSINVSGRDHSKMDFEAGGNIIFPVSQFFRLKAGIQLNYYSGNHKEKEYWESVGSAKSNSEMTMIKKVETDNADLAQPDSRIFQFSLPIGADFLLAGDEFVQWYAGATIQPGLIMPGEKLTHDRTEITTGTPANKWNMNGGIETFLNVRLNRSSNFTLGPQCRYEIISANNKPLNFFDRPFQIGFKCGITKAF